jgi:hypothetical protein
VRAGLEDVQAKQKEQATKQDVEVTVEAAKADLKVELASKADMLDLGAKIDKNTKSYKIRLEELEKDVGIRNRGSEVIWEWNLAGSRSRARIARDGACAGSSGGWIGQHLSSPRVERSAGRRS